MTASHPLTPRLGPGNGRDGPHSSHPSSTFSASAWPNLATSPRLSMISSVAPASAFGRKRPRSSPIRRRGGPRRCACCLLRFAQAKALGAIATNAFGAQIVACSACRLQPAALRPPRRISSLVVRVLPRPSPREWRRTRRDLFQLERRGRAWYGARRRVRRAR
jgi:hypothetical protein